MRVGSSGPVVDRALARQPAALVAVAIVAALAGVALAFAGQSSLSLVFALLAAIGACLLFLAGLETVLTSMIMLVAILVDFYQIFGLPLHEPIVAVVLTGVLLAALFLFQSDVRPWAQIPRLRYWAVLLAVTALAVPRGALTETSFYFVSVFLGPFLMYALGAQVARDGRRLLWLVALVSSVAVFIAIHSIVEGVTGVFLFATLRQIDYLGSVSGFHLAGHSINRAGSFLENPDWNGAYLALSFFPLAGLFLAARAPWSRALAAVGAGLVLVALLFTFTTASWLALGGGAVVMLWRVVPRRYLKQALIAIGVAAIVFGVVFHVQLRALLQHATASREITLRVGAWETALRVIQAHPLTGLGMSQNIYLLAAEPYRVAWQTRPLAHPHNAYLELAALAGIPVLLAFLVLLAMIMRTIVARWRQAPTSLQPVYGGVFTALVVFSLNNLLINGWTLAPLAMIAWLLAGAVTGRFREARPEPRPARAPQSEQAGWIQPEEPNPALVS